MQSNNPVFRRSAEFSRAGSAYQTLDPRVEAYQQGAPGMGDGLPTHTVPGRMTMDTVVQKAAITLGVVVAVAFATWALTPDITSAESLAPLYAAAMVGAGLAFVLSLVNSFKREISPALVLAFAVAEGVALGGISKIFGAYFGADIIVHAVIGTFAAFAGTLAVYKFANIRVSGKFRTMVMAAMFGMIGLGFLEMGLMFFGGGLGLYGFGPLGLIFAIGGLVLGVFMLVLDFDFIENGVRNGIPEKESWRAAFAMTVSLVWIYTNLLRILAILNND